jgi:hypothetical protein
VAFGGGILISTLLVAGVGPGSPAASPAPPAIRVDFDAPAGCSSVAAFRRAVAARLDRTPAAGETAGTRIQIRVARVGNRVEGELRLTHDEATTDTRRVEGASCDEVVDVLALTAALALQPPRPSQPRATESAPAPAQPRAAEPRAPAPARAAAREAATTLTPAPRARPARETPPSAAAPPIRAMPPGTEATRPPAPPITPARPPAAPPAIAERSATPVPTPVRAGMMSLEAGAGAAFARVLTSGLNLGGALMLGLTRAPASGVAPSLRIAWLYLPDDLSLPAGEVRNGWSAFALTACPGWGLRRAPFEGQLCARGMGGWLSATDRGVTNPRAATRSSWSAGALLRGAAEVGAGFSIELEAGVDARLIDRQFITTTPLRTVAETPPVSLLVGVGLSRRL